jgi:translation initiation factor IF-2
MTRYSKSDAPVPSGEIIVERGSSAQELGPKLNRTAADVVRFLMQQGEMVTATQSLSDDAMELFALEVGGQLLLVDPGQEQEAGLMLLLDDEDDDEAEQITRPPIITVMGHVDHGKTLLLDRFRESNVIAGEAGGITQHIGAYQVEKEGRRITFIDTPGHEAFTAMRARGAGATDIVILVVAANDGVMPQTIEALNHAKAADVPIIVAINKIDIPDSDPNRVMQQLTEYELVPEAWGGDTVMVEVSALQRLGLDDLLEQVLLVADVEDLKAVPEGAARGVVLEANLDIGRGPVATVLVERGTLKVGDPIVAGAAWGTVRALLNDKGEQIKEAGPSTPVQVLGLSQVPGAGDEFRVAPALKTAKTVAEAREQRFRFAGLRGTSSAIGGGVKLEDLFEQIQKGEQATLNLLIKADVQGSLEALTESLKKLERPEVKIGFVHRAVGAITENDVQLAATTGSTIIGFNVRPGRESRKLAEETGVQIRTYQIIYQVIEDMQKALVGMLKPEIEEVVTGDAEVRDIFSVPKIGAIAGCYVLNGVITRGSKVRFLRDGVVIWTGAIASLRRFKDDVREVATGFECGIGLTDFKDLKNGDVIETYEEREIARV